MRAWAAAIRRFLRNRFYIVFGMRGTAPVNPAFGMAEGTPVDRYYIDAFFEAHRADVRGRVLEIGDRSYADRFGHGVSATDVLSAEPAQGVTVVGDLASCPEIADDTYDVVVLVQTLHYVFDMRAAVAEVRRILRPGGVVLCTVPGISQVSRYDMDRWGDRWRLTSLGAAELFATAFGPGDVLVETYGNAHSAVCLLQGIPAERIARRRLAPREPDYEVVVCVAATKRADG